MKQRTVRIDHINLYSGPAVYHEVMWPGLSGLRAGDGHVTLERAVIVVEYVGTKE
jgi:hypothetical protein